MRYLIDDEYWKKRKPGDLSPILFHAGNEGDIWNYYRNTKFGGVTLAEKWNALVVYGEHRYFGESIPFGDMKKAVSSPYNQYNTVENVMIDFVKLIKFIKKKFNA